MVTKVARITFPDNTRMYALYSTTSDHLESDLIAVAPEQELFITSPETIPGDRYDSDVLQDAMLRMPSIPDALVELGDEIIQCEVLLYPAKPWVSKARRIANVGVVTGLRHSAEGEEEWEEEARKMNQRLSCLDGNERSKSKPWWHIWK